jgi:hypothetical protein
VTVCPFSLKSFPGEDDRPDVGITGSVWRRANILSVRFSLVGDLANVAIPAAKGPPERAERLWEETCLEFFLRVDGSVGYWEFNLSPAGHWNAYRFTRYRSGMREERAFGSLPFRVRRDPEELGLSVDADIGVIVPNGQAVQVAIGAVIRTVRGGKSHWALTHSGTRPDFHRRDGFRLDLPAATGCFRPMPSRTKDRGAGS